MYSIYSLTDHGVCSWQILELECMPIAYTRDDRSKARASSDKHQNDHNAVWQWGESPD